MTFPFPHAHELSLMLCGLALCGCAPVPPAPPPGTVAEVEAREIAFAQAMADRDLSAFLEFVSPEAVFFGAGEPLVGRDAVGKGWARFFEGEAPPFSWKPDRVVLLESGRLALSTGPVTGPAGEDWGRFNSIWRLDEDGVWRVVFDKGS